MARTAVALGLAFLLGALPGRGEDPDPDVVVAAVLRAVKDQDGEALEALARQEVPDPWLIASLLQWQGEGAAARAFARAAPRPDVEALPAYLDARQPSAAADASVRRSLQGLPPSSPDDANALAAALHAVERYVGTDTLVGILAQQERARLLRAAGQSAESVAAYHAAGDAALALGWLAGAAEAYGTAGDVAYEDVGPKESLEHTERAIAVHRRRGAHDRVMGSLGFAGHVLLDLGRPQEAMARHEEKRRLAEEHHEEEGLAEALGDLGNCWYALSDYARAIDLQRKALAAYARAGSSPGRCATLLNLGAALERIADYASASEALEESLALALASGDERLAGLAETNLANVLMSRGQEARATDRMHAALSRLERVGDAGGASLALSNLAGYALRAGDAAVARRHAERALEQAERSRRPDLVATALGSLADVAVSGEDAEQALALQQRALALFEASGDLDNQAATLQGIAILQADLGRVGDARASHERALALAERIQRTPTLVSALCGLARLALREAQPGRALEHAQRALGPAQESDGAREILTALECRAACLLALGRPGEALDDVRAALPVSARLLGGQSDERAALARESVAGLYDVGLAAAVALGDIPGAVHLVEAGRAGALLEALGGRDALRDSVLPPELASEERRARASEVAAAAAYGRARAHGSASEVRLARAALEQAREATAHVVAAIHRTQKAAANLAYPEPDPLPLLQRRLRAGQALVLLALADPPGEAHGVVLTAGAARLVALGPTRALEQAVEGLNLTDLARDPEPSLTLLRGLVTSPLALPSDVREVLLSPSGVLTYVPGTLLFPGRQVVQVASGTSLGLLEERGASAGSGVLALGGVEYAGAGAAVVGRPLAALPATEGEARAVGDELLLGPRATEADLLAAARRRPRWSAIHLACHGLLDVERPLFSSLVLTRDPANDGHLTALEVLRARLPADLVVLSACETGRGRVVRGEGLVGLARAFQFAGATRVLCSLWKVDDEATLALMRAFYEAYRPRGGGSGLPAAAALAAAQRQLQATKRWKHPYYWAAWALWGPP